MTTLSNNPLSESEHRTSVTQLESNQVKANELQYCPVCGQSYRTGELICSKCGRAFSTNGKTHIIPTNKEQTQPVRQVKGSALLDVLKPVTIEIEKQLLKVTIESKIVIGRLNNGPEELQPDIDLSQFQAEINGVSRRHLAIHYRNDLLYIMDLGSSNGTWLNGRKLIANTMNLLRDGDEMEVGNLRLRIYFE